MGKWKIDLSKLEGWNKLETGTYNIRLQSINDGYADSKLSDPIEVTKINYLCFTAEEDTEIAFTVYGTIENLPVLQYSKDAKTWSDYTIGDTISLSEGEDCYWKGDNETFSIGWSDYIFFTSTGKVAASGEITSLYDSTCKSRTIPADYMFIYLFGYCTTLITPPELPATTLTNSCYDDMFDECTSLTTAPELPATTLAEWCYEGMFYGCTSLTTAPELPATTLAEGCYAGMFYNSGVAVSSVSDNFHKKEVRIPSVGEITEVPYDAIYGMFGEDEIEVNTTYYCYQRPSDEVIASYITNVLSSYDYESGLCLKATADETKVEFEIWRFVLPVVYYSKTGSDWKVYDFSVDNNIVLANGEKCYFVGMKDSPWGNCNFNLQTGSVEAYGSANSLANPDLSITEAPFLGRVFYNCTALTKAPELPATTLTADCYQWMFSGCTSLVEPPELHATVLASACYTFMFSGCTSLTTPPKLPATVLASQCYMFMFSGCSNIKLSDTQTSEYVNEYRIPYAGTGTTASNALSYMFNSTGGTFTGTPEINTTYYTSNTIV